MDINYYEHGSDKVEHEHYIIKTDTVYLFAINRKYITEKRHYTQDGKIDLRKKPYLEEADLWRLEDTNHNVLTESESLKEIFDYVKAVYT